MVVGDQNFEQDAADTQLHCATFDLLHQPAAPALTAIGRRDAKAAAPAFLTAHSQQRGAHSLRPSLLLRHQDCTILCSNTGTAQIGVHGSRFHVHIVPIIDKTAIEAFAQGFDCNRGAGYDGRLLGFQTSRTDLRIDVADG